MPKDPTPNNVFNVTMVCKSNLAYANYLWICKHGEVSYGVKIFLKCLYDKGLHK
jgi:hypothetical protein